MFDLTNVQVNTIRELFIKHKLHKLQYIEYKTSSPTQLKKRMHVYEVIFKNEYDHLNLDIFTCLKKIDNLSLPTRIKNIIYRELDVYTVGDLLSLEIDDIFSLKHIEPLRFEILMDCLQNLDYNFNPRKINEYSNYIQNHF